MVRYEVFSNANLTDSASEGACVLHREMLAFWTITGQRTTQKEKRMQPLVVDYQRGPEPTKVSIPLLMNKNASAKDSAPSLLPSPSIGPLQLAQATKHWSSNRKTIN